MLPALLGLFFTSGVKAEPIAGLNAVAYTITEVPPTKSDTAYEICGSETENNINRNFNGEPIAGCPVDLFMVHYTGFITIPENNTIQFMVAGDDGATVKIGLNEFGYWGNQGCSWRMSGQLDLDAGSYALDGWYYEDGGYTCYMLAWNINNTGWAYVPDSAFTTNGVSTTTTIEETTTTWQTTTVPQTSTTVAVTTSLAASTTVAVSTTDVTTTVPVTSTSVVETSTTTTSTTTTTVFVPTQTTSTIVYIVPETTTTTTQPEVTTTTQEVTTTTTEVEPETTTTTTILTESTVPDTQPEETTTSTTDKPSETSLEPVTEVQTSVPSTTVETTIQTLLEPPSDDFNVTELPNSNEEVATYIIEVVSNPDQLSQLSEEQLEQVFEQLDVSELTLEEAEQLVEVLNSAPTKVKKAFQESVNVFSGLFNSYVMVGQNIPVEDRRTLLALTNAMTVSGMSLRRRSK